MSQSRRAFNRVPFFESCTIACDGARKGPYPTLDLGVGGFAFLSDVPHEDGEEVTAIFNGAVSEVGVITYCELVENEGFKVGVNFLKSRERCQQAERLN